VRLLRANELTAVWVPDQQQEAMRDLTRMREDMKDMERQAKQRLSGFLLRNKKVYAGDSKWTQAHLHRRRLRLSLWYNDSGQVSSWL
jgi:transposase